MSKAPPVRGVHFNSGAKNGAKRYYRRAAARLLRHWAKLDPENAPRTIRGVLEGYAD